ncbi:transporter [Methylobacterium haplocladii]|uniref:CoxB-like protein n=1 Tax=Methylobacterium haplocladii TaxID=1176176 RepID=A0A512IK87_9HYPH|nr:transporter [Methylobacterium haplocladii]GEO98072.1 hypothetical protein MHA02_04600 [Methylobacterium haplocladii]GJD85691.1 hypothetical protein HPGCJGGD_3582 [Methylobacterium haplocladii]
MMKNWLAAGAFALTAGMTATAAQAQTTTVPGEQVGLATGAPLPEGVYALNTFVYRSPDAPTVVSPVDVAVNIPVLVWATPWVPLGGRIELLVAPPTVFAFGRSSGPTGIKDLSINVGTFVGGIWAFDLGGNFGVSVLGGVYLNDLNGDRGVLVQNNGAFVGAPVLTQLASNTYRAGIAASYTGDNWNITANLTGNFYDSPGRFDGNNTFGTRGPFVISDSLNLDLTATKKFDLFNEGKAKFEFGAIGYGTVNVGSNANIVGRQGRFALGGLVGYDFGLFTAQAYVARDVVTQARFVDATGRSRDIENTEGWFRIIVPLYSPAPAPAPAPIVRKY